MIGFQEEYLRYRIEKSKEALTDAVFLSENKSWNACINRLYYSCYYMVSALCLKKEIPVQTHSGLKRQFGLSFVKTGIVTVENGKLFSDLMDWRQKGDYGDMFDFDQETVEPLLNQVKGFIDSIEIIINEN